MSAHTHIQWCDSTINPTSGCDGCELYSPTAPHLAKVGGSLLYAGVGDAALIAEPGQAWDAVLLVRYPSRAAFLAMVADPAYQAITHLRHDALVEAVLQPTHPWQVAAPDAIRRPGGRQRVGTLKEGDQSKAEGRRPRPV
jgi:uncharacterized protein (DUF1330 family)